MYIVVTSSYSKPVQVDKYFVACTVRAPGPGYKYTYIVPSRYLSRATYFIDRPQLQRVVARNYIADITCHHHTSCVIDPFSENT